MYSAILKFIPKYCGFILEVSEGVHGTDEFDFLVNAVWPEVVTAIETRASVIFAPGNPDTFYKVNKIIIYSCKNNKKTLKKK